MYSYNQILQQILNLKKNLKDPTKDPGPIKRHISLLKESANALLESNQLNIETDEVVAVKRNRELLQLKESLRTATGKHRSALQRAFNNLASRSGT
jgi:CHASE3 domain sensor protein